jgi:hypothetical protein
MWPTKVDVPVKVGHAKVLPAGISSTTGLVSDVVAPSNC